MSNDIMTREDYQNHTKAELMEMMEERAWDRSQNPFDHINTRATKDAMVSALLSDDVIEEAGGSTSYVCIDNESDTVPLSSLHINPYNNRPLIDYIDTDHEDRILSSMGSKDAPLNDGVLGTIVVTPVECIDENAEEEGYYIVSGNRTTYTLKNIAEDLDRDLDDEMIEVQVRHYSGDRRQVLAQMFREIDLPNISQLKPSAIDMLRSVKNRLELGISQAQVADELGWSYSKVSNLLKLDRLNDDLLNLVHTNERREFYSNMTVPTLERYDVNYVQDDDGSLSILGISQSHALVMADCIPDKPRRSQYADDKRYQKAVFDWVELKDALNAHFSSVEVIREAMDSAVADFEGWIHIHLMKSGNFDDDFINSLSTFKNRVNTAKQRAQEEMAAQIQAAKSESEPDTSTTVEAEASDEDDIPPAPSGNDDWEDDNLTKKAKGKTDKSYADSMRSSEISKEKIFSLWHNRPDKFIGSLKRGFIDFDLDWADIAVKKLNSDDEKMKQFINLAVDMGLIVSNI